MKHEKYMDKIEVWQCPAGNGWFITIGGLMDTDAGYFKTENQARAHTWFYK